MDPLLESQLLTNRRHFFGKAATGLGIPALAHLLNSNAPASEDEVLASARTIAPKAKRVVYLFQNGAPSHLELFDHKPKLAELHGKPVPASYMEGKRFSTMSAAASKRQLLNSVEPFTKHGQSGATVSALMPHTAKVAKRT